jgi:DNA polymerase-3 subunit gamma/tau
MSYQVLARKYRPRSFSELVGQEQVVRALRHALDQNRLHHAYLFTGTRGVGKTTLARILARCLNCETGVSAKPCGTCAACKAISEGRFVDLIEVDAASRTKVEDTRDLLDNVQYAPSMGRYKVYLIDEVHMLSSHSFNALLKTLEEPPPHVKFLLATTDPQKLPITVLSRCLQFNLKMLPAELIADHLAELLQQESLRFEKPALMLLGRAAAGSMRDALSLTDQAIAYGSESVTEAGVRELLGSVDRDHVLKLLEALAGGKPKEMLASMDDIFSYHPDALALLDELISHLHQLAILQVVPERGDERLRDWAARFQPEQLQLYYDIAVRGRPDLVQVADGRGALEMLLLRMLLFRPEGVLLKAPLPPGENAPAKKPDAPVEAPPEEQPQRRQADRGRDQEEPHPVPAAGTTSGTGPSTVDSPAVDSPTARSSASGASSVGSARAASLPEKNKVVADVADVTVDDVVADAVAGPETESAAPGVTPVGTTGAVPSGSDNLDDWWCDLLPRLHLEGSVLNLAANGQLVTRSGQSWVLALPESQRIWDNPERRSKLAQAVSNYFDKPVKVDFHFVEQVEDTPRARAEDRRKQLRQQVHQSVVSDPCVQQLMSMFGAKLDEASISPLDEEPDHGI